jgi:hypothetical protein
MNSTRIYIQLKRTHKVLFFCLHELRSISVGQIETVKERGMSTTNMWQCIKLYCQTYLSADKIPGNKCFSLF